MAKCETSKPSYKLTLTEEEALYMIGLTQNALTDNESQEDREKRENIFTALRSAVPKSGGLR